MIRVRQQYHLWSTLASKTGCVREVGGIGVCMWGVALSDWFAVHGLSFYVQI